MHEPDSHAGEEGVYICVCVGGARSDPLAGLHCPPTATKARRPSHLQLKREGGEKLPFGKKGREDRVKGRREGPGGEGGLRSPSPSHDTERN